jgi:hypothetical protein
MDISELQLKINKNSAVNDLKAVESQLDKTGKAADGLIETLKDIGLSVGFGKLIKDSLQLNSQFSSLSSKFKSIFSDGFDTKVFSELKSELTLSDSALKNILSTTGQFAKGLNQSSQYIKSFSTDLTKAAADYAAYQGKTSAADVNEYARKFAKATLGEVGELKDIGIIIDTTSESFKKAVEEMKNLTGATEAQARQMVIQKELMEQVQIAAGSASKNMYDGWAQLNKLFDQFKEILADVGNIFSTALGPILSTLNSILEIPFVKSAVAWGIAIGAVVVGYSALMKTLNKVAGLLKINNGLQQLEPEILKKVFLLQDKILKTKENQLKVVKQIAELESGKGAKSRLYDREKLLKFKLVGNAEQIQKLNKELKSLDQSVLDAIPGIKGMDEKFKKHVSSLGLLSTGLKITTAYTLGAAAAEKILALSRMNLASGTSILGAMFKKISIAFGAFWKTLSGGIAGLAGVKTAFTAIGLAAAKLSVVLLGIVAVFDVIKVIVNLFTGQDWNSGTITRWFAEWVYGLDELDKKNKELAESNKKAFKQLKEVENLKKQLQDLKLDRIIANILPEAAIKELESKAKKIKKELQTNEWIVANFGAAKDKGLVKVNEGETDFEARTRYQKMVNEGYQNLWATEDAILQKRKSLIDLNKQFAKSLDQINLQMDKVYEDFNYGYQKGKFGNYSEDQRDINRDVRMSELKQRLSALSNKKDMESLKSQQSIQEELFKLTQEKAKYEIDSLLQQREAALNNLKTMNDIIRQSVGFKQTAQEAVEANSMEAIGLQSRRYEATSKSEYAPIVEQQKQVKEIEKQVLVKQNQAVSTLEKINNQIYKVVQKIGSGSGASSEVINAVNPF